MKKLILFLLLPLWMVAQTSSGMEQEFDYGIKNNSTQTITTPPYLTTTGMDGTQGKIPSALIAKTSDVADSLATKEKVANKSDSYTASSSITYASTKALVDGLATKIGNTFTEAYGFDDVLSQDPTTNNVEKRTLQPESTRLDSYLAPIFAWGDSLTNGYSTTPYPDQLAVLFGYPVTNNGVGGETSTQIKDRLVADAGNYSKSVIIWAGRNNFASPTTIKADIATMISTIGHTRYLVLGVLNANTEPISSTEWTQITTLNADLKAIYGNKYVDIREYLVSQYNPSIPQDVIDFGNDVVPTSLRLDGLHLNTAGNAKVAGYLNQRLGRMFDLNGYFQSKDFKYYLNEAQVIGGTGSINQVSFWNGLSSQAGSSFFTWDDSIKRLVLRNPGANVNLAESFAIGSASALGDTAGSYSYISELQQAPSTSVSRFQTAAYRRVSGTGFQGTGFRMQYAVDDSFTTGERAYIEIGASDPTNSGGGFISLGTAGVDRLSIFHSGNVNIGGLTDNSVDKLQVEGTIKATSYTGDATLTGTPTAPTAPVGTNTTQIATTAFVQAAIAGNYKVYTALLSQTGTSAPTATVLENTLGGTIVWSRSGAGGYLGTLAGAFTANKTAFITSSNVNNNPTQTVFCADSTLDAFTLNSFIEGAPTDGVISRLTLEIRVYN